MLKSTVEQLSPTRVRINVEVPFDELKPSFDRAYRKLASEVRIPGFRPGKAPARVLQSRLGRGVVLNEVIEDAVPRQYLAAVNSAKVNTVGRPKIELANHDENAETLEFSAEVDVRPEFDLPAFDNIAVTVDARAVKDADIDAELDQLRARFGTLTGVERPVQTGDFVVIDLTATVDGDPVGDATTSGLSYEVGSGQLVDGIDDALVDATSGETRTFTTKLVAGEFAGQDAEVAVTVQGVKERELPVLDDEFAQIASEFDTIDELRADARERVTASKKMEQAAQIRDKVLNALLDAIEVPLPEDVIAAQVDASKHEIVHAFGHEDDNFAAWLSQQGQTLEEFDAELRTGAEREVKSQFVLDTIADADDIHVSEQEVAVRIEYQARRFGIDPAEYAKRAHESGQLGVIYADIRRGKALASVVRQANVTDTAGNTVSVDELFGFTKDEIGIERPAEVGAPNEV